MEVCSSSPITSLSHQCHTGTACLPGAAQRGTDVPENCSGREQPPEGTAGTQTSWAGNHPGALLLHPARCKLPYHSFICTTQLKVSTRNKNSQGETAPTSADHQSCTRTTQTQSSVTSQGHEHPHTRGSCPSPGVPAGAGCPGQPTSTAQLAGTHQPCPRARSITSFFLLLILAALQSFSFLHFFFFCAATRSSAKNSSSPSRTPSSSSEDEKDNSRGRPPRAQLSFALPCANPQPLSAAPSEERRHPAPELSARPNPRTPGRGSTAGPTGRAERRFHPYLARLPARPVRMARSEASNRRRPHRAPSSPPAPHSHPVLLQAALGVNRAAAQRRGPGGHRGSARQTPAQRTARTRPALPSQPPLLRPAAHPTRPRRCPPPPAAPRRPPGPACRPGAAPPRQDGGRRPRPVTSRSAPPPPKSPSAGTQR